MTTITKKDIIREISEAHGTSQTSVRATVDAFIDSIARAVDDGDEISLPGFGKFKCRENSARMGRNPSTGESMEIPASRTLTFKCAKQMKDRLN